MGCFDLFVPAASKKAQEKAQLITLKKGKTPEQQRCIDFFFHDDKSGCLSSNTTTYTLGEYQTLVARKCAELNLRQKAINKIGLDESQIQEIEPIVLTSFRFDDDSYIKVKDKAVVSSKYSVSWIFFSREQLFTYTFILDMTSDNTWEYTNDYFYTDITSISTSRLVKEKIDITIGSGCLNGNKDNVTKSNYVIDSLEITAAGVKDSFTMRNSTTMEESVQAVKAMIREKKYEK